MKISVYKVVRANREGRLLSVYLPDHLASVYRDEQGRILTVPDALAFDTPERAHEWMQKAHKLELQLWAAEAETATPVDGFRIYYGVEVRLPRFKGDVRELTPQTMSREQWLELVALIDHLPKHEDCHDDHPAGEAHFDSHGNGVGDGDLSCLIVDWETQFIRGSVRCSNLTLKECLATAPEG